MKCCKYCIHWAHEVGKLGNCKVKFPYWLKKDANEETKQFLTEEHRTHSSDGENCDTFVYIPMECRMYIQKED